MAVVHVADRRWTLSLLCRISEQRKVDQWTLAKVESRTCEIRVNLESELEHVDVLDIWRKSIPKDKKR